MDKDLKSGIAIFIIIIVNIFIATSYLIGVHLFDRAVVHEDSDFISLVLGVATAALLFTHVLSVAGIIAEYHVKIGEFLFKDKPKK